LQGRWGFIEGLSWVALEAELRRLFEVVGHVPSTRVGEAQESLERAIEDLQVRVWQAQRDVMNDTVATG